MPLWTLNWLYSDIIIQKIKFLLNVRFLVFTLDPMIEKSASSKIMALIRSAAAAMVLPVLFIYIMIAKPDYRIMNGLAHVILPIANVVGDIITWPVRVVGNTVENIYELSTLRSKNEELRVRLDEALANKNICDIAIAENKKMEQEIGVIRNIPQKTIIADVIHDNRSLHHNTFLINRGTGDGIVPGMVVVSPSYQFAGVIIDTGDGFARVRSVTDTDTNIAVRIAGYEVYGFLTGNGSTTPTIGFFSDPQFRAAAGLQLITSNISGVLPAGIYVGQMKNQDDVDVLQPGRLSSVIVLRFDTDTNYK